MKSILTLTNVFFKRGNTRLSGPSKNVLLQIDFLTSCFSDTVQARPLKCCKYLTTNDHLKIETHCLQRPPVSSGHYFGVPRVDVVHSQYNENSAGVTKINIFRHRLANLSFLLRSTKESFGENLYSSEHHLLDGLNAGAMKISL